MQDYKHREIKEGDVLLLTYKYNSFEIATLIGDKVRTLSTIKRAPQSYSIYLLENPTTEEIAEKDAIIKEWNKHTKQKKKEKKQKKEYGTMLGGIYSTVNGNGFVYLGNLHIKDYKDDTNEIIWESSGNTYLYIGRITEYVNSTKDFIKKDPQNILSEKYHYRFNMNKGYKVVSGLAGIHPLLKRSDYHYIIGTYYFEEYDYNLKTNVKIRREIELNTEK